MRSKIPGKSTRIPDAFDSTVYKTERTCCAKIAEWINRIIEDNHLDFGSAEVETRSSDDKYPDIIICATSRSSDVACVMEFKQPYFDPLDLDELKEPAHRKANSRHSPYFVTSNFQELIWWNTTKVNELKPDHEQIVHRYSLSLIEDLNQIEEFKYKESIKKSLEQFILKLYAVYTQKEPEPKHAIDDILIYLLQMKIHRLARLYREIIENTTHKDTKFSKELQKWFIEQGWSFAYQQQDYDKAARQTAYLLVNKILFYNLLQAKRPHELDPLEIPEGLTKGALLQSTLQAYFNQVLKIDYETIYTTDFIDTIAFPDVKEVVKEIKGLVDFRKRYDFSKLGYDIIGRIFERLIPQDVRHNLGQYFTNADVVDLILRFCLHHEDDKVLDPACGAGTFLVRAYQHKKMMNQRKEHERILDSLWGNDIAKFPAHLSTINLAINDLSVDKNYPNIIKEDFFALRVGSDGFDPVNYRKVRAKTLGVTEREVIYPRWFDVIVGNPPYTRQEEIPKIGVDKEKLIENALLDPKHKKIADISKRAGIHAYFFVHGTKFLSDGGHFGFIVSNSWLDVEYGKGLQEFFLNNYKIIAIIESKVERWFEDADINTCIVILQKCKSKNERDENLVRFVYLNKSLRHFIPPAQDMWQKKKERVDKIDDLKQTILAHNDFYENDELRIYPKTQKELWDEGFDTKEQKFVGAKWGKYLRAPEIFFRILERGKEKLVPLREAAKVRRGFTTGANEFFYLTDDEIARNGIEKKYIRSIIFSLKEIKGYKLDRNVLFNEVIICHNTKKELKGTNLLKYIERGERQGYNKRPTCKSREPAPWYSLGKGWQYAPLIFPAKVGERMPVFLNDNVFEDKKLYGITPKNSEETLILAALLNSTLSRFFIEFTCRQMTGAQAIADIDVIVVESLPVFDISIISENTKGKLINKFNNLIKTNAVSIFKEIAPSPEQVLLNKIKPELRELDEIIMGDILGLTDEEQLEVYRAVIDLVRSRLDQAKSIGTRHKTKEGIDVDILVKTVMDKIGDGTLGKFYKENISSQKNLATRTIPQPAEEVTLEKSLFGWRIKIGKKYVDCNTEAEAKYLKILAQAGLDKIKIPKDQKYLKKILPELEPMKKKMDIVINDYLSSILDRKLREKLLHYIWQEIMK